MTHPHITKSFSQEMTFDQIVNSFLQESRHNTGSEKLCAENDA